MNSVWLEDFLVLLESGGFSRAAERRSISQPSFSRRILALEEWIGVPLIDRTTHTVRATPAGERFRVVAEDVLRRLQMAQVEAHELAGVASTKLRFAATHALSLTFFPAWLRSLESAEDPMPTVELIADHMVACEGVMIKGEAQFLLCHHHELAATRFTQGFISAFIGRDHLVPVASPRLLASRVANGLPRIEFTAESGMGRILRAAREAAPLNQPPPIFQSHLASVLAAMARAGKGLAWCPLSLVEEDIRTGVLVVVPDVGTVVPIEIRLWRPKTRLSPVAEAFWRRVKHAEENARQQSYAAPFAAEGAAACTPHDVSA